MRTEIKVLIIGSTGMLGSALRYHLLTQKRIKLFQLKKSSFDILKDKVETLPLSMYDWIINAAGIINRRIKNKSDIKTAYRINSEFPIALADRCEKLKVKMIHQSTDCVFDGSIGLYNELAKPSAHDIYGKSKLMGEPKNCLVIRTSLIGPETKNFYSLLCWFLRQETCEGYSGHLWNGMTTLQASEIIKEIIIKNLYVRRIQHFFSDDISKYHLLKLIKQTFLTKTLIIKNSKAKKDMRLRSIYNDDLACLKINNIKLQLKRLKKITNNYGLIG